MKGCNRKISFGFGFLEVDRGPSWLLCDKPFKLRSDRWTWVGQAQGQCSRHGDRYVRPQGRMELGVSGIWRKTSGAGAQLVRGTGIGKSAGEAGIGGFRIYRTSSSPAGRSLGSTSNGSHRQVMYLNNREGTWSRSQDPSGCWVGRELQGEEGSGTQRLHFTPAPHSTGQRSFSAICFSTSFELLRQTLSSVYWSSSSAWSWNCRSF